MTFDDGAFPNHIASVNVTGLNRTNDAKFTTRVPGDHQAIHDQRRCSIGIARLIVGDLVTPHHVTGFGIQCNNPRIQSAKDDLVTIDGCTAVDHVTAWQNTFGQACIILPELLAGFDVNRVHPRIRTGDIHHAIIDQRLGFLSTLLFSSKAKRPGRHKTFDVFLVQCVKRAIALKVAAHAVCNNLIRDRLVIGKHFFGHIGHGAGGTH